MHLTILWFLNNQHLHFCSYLRHFCHGHGLCLVGLSSSYLTALVGLYSNCFVGLVDPYFCYRLVGFLIVGLVALGSSFLALAGLYSYSIADLVECCFYRLVVGYQIGPDSSFVVLAGLCLNLIAGLVGSCFYFLAVELTYFFRLASACFLALP